ncbi:MAG TPA: MBL fold metallo-hydrolase [Chloroflexia bacterium]|nr:MBL fold metallo-hydrolase [Chloroflexia bacterium]
MKQITSNLYTFTGLIVGRVYLIEDGDGLTIIDTSLPFAPKRIIKQLQEMGRAPSDVKRIIITHSHPDHVGGLPELARATGAEVWASEGEAAVIRGEMPVPRPPVRSVPWPQRILRFILPPAKMKPGKVHRILKDGETLEVMGGLQVISTPGHAPDHLSFWQPERRILFAGDTMMYLFGRLDPLFRVVTVDMPENMRSVRKLAALEPQTILCGHGAPITERATAMLNSLARRNRSNNKQQKGE